MRWKSLMCLARPSPAERSGALAALHPKVSGNTLFGYVLAVAAVSIGHARALCQQLHAWCGSKRRLMKRRIGSGEGI